MFARTIQLRAVLAITTVIAVACSGSAHSPSRPPPSSPTPQRRPPVACSAEHGRLVASHIPFTLLHRLVQPFEYINVGPACEASGFPVVHLYDDAHRRLNVRQVNGDIVLGTAEATGYLLGTNDDSSGFNIETPVTGSCSTGRYVSASFAVGTTPLVAVSYQVCGAVYVTTIFR